MNARTRALVNAAKALPDTLTPERLAALREVIDWQRLEAQYADTRHFYLANTGHLRKTIRLVPSMRWGKVPTEFYIPTPKGRRVAAEVRS